MKKKTYRVTIAKKDSEYLIKMKDQLLAKKDKLIEGEVGKRLRIGEGLKATRLTIDIEKEDLIKAQRKAYQLSKREGTIAKVRKEKEDVYKIQNEEFEEQLRIKGVMLEKERC